MAELTEVARKYGSDASSTDDSDSHVGFRQFRSFQVLKMFCFWLLRILFELRQRGIHLIPRVRVGCPHVHLRFEPTQIIQTCGSDGNKLRNGVGPNHNRRATVGTKAAASHPALLAWRSVKAGRPLQELEGFRRHDDVRRKRPATGSLAIATVAVKHQSRFGCAFVANRAASASA